MMPLALVTGAHGAIGKHVVTQLSAAGWRVAGIGHGPASWVGEGAPDLWLAADVTPANLDLLSDRLDRPFDLVIDLIGGSGVSASLRDPVGDFHKTVVASIHVLDFIRRRSPRARLVAVSSAAVYGDRHSGPIREEAQIEPISVYGHNKLMMEKSVAFWARTFGISAVIVRLFSVYGPGLRKQMIFDLCMRLSTGADALTVWGTGTEERDWISIKDAARLLIDLSAFANMAAPVYNGCTGEAHTVSEMAHMLSRAWGLGAKIAFDGVVRAGDPRRLVGSIDRLATTGFRPRISLEMGLCEVVADVRWTLDGTAA